MGLFGKNINKYIEEFKAEDGILLVDVREADEYALGRIPGSINVPLS
ncbi:MAG: rhodanese-like domain-containing protein, partial [[Eubacterium] sulci]|nr:rhodanese-like domain-containing protein [[Eubacterium] sulci]